jgi:hypothetical protein
MKKLAIAFVSVVTAFSGATPAAAFPVINLTKPEVVSNIEQVRDHGWGGWHGRRFYRNFGGYRGRNYGGYRYNKYGRYYGHRYNHHHNNNDAAAIIGGLALGAIIGGALAQPYYAPSYAPSYAYGGDAHTRWCYSQYRSYRAWDNTFQPYYGPRRQCIAPF